MTVVCAREIQSYLLHELVAGRCDDVVDIRVDFLLHHLDIVISNGLVLNLCHHSNLATCFQRLPLDERLCLVEVHCHWPLPGHGHHVEDQTQVVLMMTLRTLAYPQVGNLDITRQYNEKR